MIIQTTKQFEKDLKRMKKRGKDLVKLKRILQIILDGNSLPKKFKNHKLSGNYSGTWECHIEPDWLLIYRIEKVAFILIRTGTHADLFE